MFRSVTKKKNEISIERCLSLLSRERRATLAVNGEQGYPYSIPINYVFLQKENQIAFHSSKKGYKVDCLRKSDKVCLTVFGNETIKQEDWAPFMESVVVFGKCHLANDERQKYYLFEQFAYKYYPDKQLAKQEIEKAGQFADIYVIEIEHICGKEIQEK